MSTAIAESKSAYHGPSTEIIANKLISIRLPQVIEELVNTNRGIYEGQIKQLEKQLEDNDVPQEAKSHVRAAIETLRQAEIKAKEPVREKIAIAILSLLREHRIPLQLKNGQPAAPADAKAQGEGKPRGRRKRVDPDAVCDQIKILARQAGEEGFSTTQVQEHLGVSQPIALKFCRLLVERNEINHNDRPRQFSRYYAKEYTAK